MCRSYKLNFIHEGLNEQFVFIKVICVYHFHPVAGGWKRDEDDAAQVEGGGEGSDEEFLWGIQPHSLQNSGHIISTFWLILSHTFFAVKDEDSDMDVPEDEGSGSDVEECRPSKPRPIRKSIMTGI